MNTRIKYILIFTLLLLGTVVLNGQDISVRADHPSVVRVGQQFTIMWTVNTGGGELTAPSFEGFYKIMGPQTSFSSSTQIIKGKVTRETSYTYVYYLQALTEGNFVIAPASFTLKNRTYISDSIRIQVVGGAASAQGQPSTSGTTTPSGQTQSTGEDMFVQLSLNRNNVLLGEHIVATVKLFTRQDIAGINEIKFPRFDGFLKVDLDTPPLTSLQRETIDGVVYGTGVIQQFLLYPQITGEITIEPVQISVLVRQKTGRRDPFFGDVFDDFFTQYQTIPRAVISRGAKIQVRPLPGIRPDDFSGIVGRVKMNAGLNRDSVRVNEAINLKITVSGSGNLKLAAAPGLKLPADIEVYEPKVTDEIKNSLSGTAGQKSFEYLLIPRHYGDYSIPPISYSYFNTSTGSYERLSTPELRFHAGRSSDASTGITVYGGVSKEDVKYLGQDIRFIRAEPARLTKTGNLLLSNRSFYTIYGFALLLFLALLFARREHVRRNADIAAVKNRKAARIAVKRLKEASRCLKNGEMDKFYEEILRSLWGYIGDKLNIPVSELTRNKAFLALSERGAGEQLITSLTEILDKCEYARFAPSSSDTEAEKIYDGASFVIRSVENLKG